MTDKLARPEPANCMSKESHLTLLGGPKTLKVFCDPLAHVKILLLLLEHFWRRLRKHHNFNCLDS
jgi:hypothetical protein